MEEDGREGEGWEVEETAGLPSVACSLDIWCAECLELSLSAGVELGGAV